MSNLEKWFYDESETVKETWLQEKTSNEIWDVLDGEGSVSQMIWDIENEKIRYSLSYFMNKKDNPLQSQNIQEEISIYYNEIEPRLKDEKLKEIFNHLVNNRLILPSSILREFKIRDKILEELDSEAKKLMEISLVHITPSGILRDKSIYKDLASIKDLEGRELVLRFLNNWSSAIWAKDEYEYYLCIKNYNYKSDDLKEFIISLIIEEKIYPSDILRVFELFQDKTECWENTKNFIRSKIDSEW